jgi:hypothetical protein
MSTMARIHPRGSRGREGSSIHFFEVFEIFALIVMNRDSNDRLA